MVKIKVKKKMNLPQLIEWAWKDPKEVESKIFESDNIDYFSNTAHVQFSNDGFGVRMSSSVSIDDTFTVEVEEEITEDTVIDEMLLIYDNGVTHIAENKNLSFISKGNLKSAYYMNDDLRLILIWRDGRLIE